MRDLILDGDLLLDVLVHITSIEYVFFISPHIFMACGRSFKEFSFVSYILFLIKCQQSLSASLFRICPQSSILLSLLSWSIVIGYDDQHNKERGYMMSMVVHTEDRGEIM